MPSWWPAPLEAQRWRRTAGAWTVLERRATPSHPLGTRLSTISGHTASVFWLVKMTQSGAVRASARPLAPGMNRCRTLSEEGDVFRRRCRHFHEWHERMRVLRHEDRALHEECRSGERRQYSRHRSAETTGTAGHAHAVARTAAHGSQGTCQDPQAQHQYDHKAAMTHAFAPASSPLVGVAHRKRSTLLHEPKSYCLYSHIVACWSTSAVQRPDGFPTPAHEKERQANQCGICGHEEEKAEEDPNT